MLINSLNISLSNLPKEGGSRGFSVIGERGASFILQVIRLSDGHFYNFKSKTFAAGFTNNNNLKAVLASSRYSDSILFPSNAARDLADQDEIYNIILLPNPATETSISGSKNIIRKSIVQAVDRELKFTAKADVAATYTSTPPDTSVTVTGNPSGTYKRTLSLDWTFSNTQTDANGFGLRLIRQPNENDFRYKVGHTVNGEVDPASTLVVLDDVTDLAVGMALVSGASSGTPVIKAIDTITKTVTLSSSSTFSDGASVTFDAIGMTAISKATGISVKFNELTATATELTKTVRDGGIHVTDAVDGNSATISLNGTYGIAGGNHVGIRGLNVNNSSANKVTSVSPHTSQGSIVVQANQTLTAGTKLYFDGCAQEIKIKGSIEVTGFPSSNVEIFFMTDNFITPGAAS